MSSLALLVSITVTRLVSSSDQLRNELRLLIASDSPAPANDEVIAITSSFAGAGESDAMSSLSSFRNWSELETSLVTVIDTNSASEDIYKTLWQSAVAPQQDLGSLAVQGGLLADRLA